MILSLLERDAAELLRGLTEVSHAVSNAASLDYILHLASEQAARLLGAERALVLLIDDAGGLRIRAQHGLDEPPTETFVGPLTETLIARLAPLLGQTSPERVLAVPLVVRGHVTGLLAVGHPPGRDTSGPSEAILTALADQIAAPLESARLAEEVREAELVAENAERATGVGIFRWDLAAGSVSWSPEIYRLLGLAPGTPATGAAMLAAVHPDDRAATEASLAAFRAAAAGGDGARAGDDFVEREYRVVHPDGSVRWLATRARIVSGTEQRPARLLGVVFDVTERKRVEAALRESDERFRLATEALAGFLYDWDPATNRVERFGGMAEVLGFRLDEVPPIAVWFECRVHPDDLPRLLDAARAAFDSDAPGYSHVYRCLHRDGHYVHVADRARFVRDASGRVIRVLGGINDISERWHLENERTALLGREREARAAAEAAARARDDMLGIVSHDLRNSVGAIGVCASALVQSPEPLPETARRILRAIQDSAESTDRLIRDLLDVVSIEARHLALELRDQAPGSLLTAVAELFAATAGTHGVALEMRVEPDLPAIRVDADRLAQALVNLVTNALKYTGPGGRITLRTERDPEGIRFAVQDTGAGIAPEDLPHVFDRFWQNRKGASQLGTGLGLAIVRGIVDAHGGHVGVESAPGAGSQFSFTIPVATQPLHDRSREPTAEGKGGAKHSGKQPLRLGKSRSV